MNKTLDESRSGESSVVHLDEHDFSWSWSVVVTDFMVTVTVMVMAHLVMVVVMTWSLAHLASYTVLTWFLFQNMLCTYVCMYCCGARPVSVTAMARWMRMTQ